MHHWKLITTATCAFDHPVQTVDHHELHLRSEVVLKP